MAVFGFEISQNGADHAGRPRLCQLARRGGYNRILANRKAHRTMTLEIHAPQADSLAQALATATGEDIDTAVVRAIEERLARIPRRREADRDADIDALFDRLARMPVLDPVLLIRSSDTPPTACRVDGHRHVRHFRRHHRRIR
jgi:hypothetical protein